MPRGDITTSKIVSYHNNDIILINCPVLVPISFKVQVRQAFVYLLSTLEVPTCYTCKHFHIAALRSDPILQFFHDVMNAAQGSSYLIYEGSFGCSARWHVGLVQVESPGGETTVHIWRESNSSRRKTKQSKAVTHCSRCCLTIKHMFVFLI